MRRFAVVGALAACTPGPAPAPVRPAPVVVAEPVEVGITAPPASLGVSSFYAKYLDVEGLPVLGSALVSDAALHEAAFLIRRMMGHRPEVLRTIGEAKIRFVVMAPTEMTTDLPEHSDLEPKAYWDRRARGLGATLARPVTSCGEENLLQLAGDPYASESILIHELSHTIHELGVAVLDPTFQGRLEAAYAHARDAGLWAGTYAMTNAAEYWAEAAQSWFDANRRDDGEHGAIATREALIEYDPDVAALLTEVFGADAWRYEAPDARLAGVDRSAVFAWPDTAADELVELPLLADPGAASSGAATTILFVNARADEVEVLWIDFDGGLVPYATVRPGATHAQSTYAGHAWVIRARGAVLGYVVADAAAGRIELR